MVTTVTFPPERLTPRPYDEADELDAVLISRSIVRRLATFVDDPTQAELVNWGGGPSTAQVDAAGVAAAGAAGHGIGGIFATAPPADLDVYRDLLPRGLELPDEPEVGFAAVDFNRGNPVTRYQEGWITLKARCVDGREAWYVLSMPVTSLPACYAGISFGYPKYLTDEMTVSERRAEARYEGRTRFALDFTPGPVPVPDEQRLRSQGIFAVGDALTLHPTRQGPKLLHWFQRDRAGERRFDGAVLEWEAGIVRPYLDPDDVWAPLLDPGVAVPGVRQRVLETGASDLVCEKVGEVR